MSEALKVYEQFITEENQLCKRIETLNIIQSYILHTVHEYGHELDILIVEDVLTAVTRIHHDLLTELIGVWLEKSIYSHRNEQDKIAVG